MVQYNLFISGVSKSRLGWSIYQLIPNIECFQTPETIDLIKTPKPKPIKSQFLLKNFSTNNNPCIIST